MLKKHILITCSVALFGIWIALGMLGKKILPGAPIYKAWIVPLGSSGWEYVMIGMADEGMTRDALTGILGTPNDVMISVRHLGRTLLVYTNPHDSKREVCFTVSADHKIIDAVPVGP